MKKAFSLTTCLVALLFSLLGCNNNQNNRSGSKGNNPSHIVSLDIVAFNDFHGNTLDSDTGLGLAKTTSLINELTKHNNNRLLISQGDMWQGSAESNLTHGNLVTEWMNEQNFVSMTLGNHEFDWGQNYITENKEIANFPFLAINVYSTETNSLASYCQPSTIAKIGSAKIGIIGAVGDCYSSIASSKSKGIYFKVGNELTSLVKAEAKSLKEQGCDFIIYSVHDDDSAYNIELSDGYVDLVLEGHTHKNYVRKDAKGVYHVQGGGYNKSVPYISLDIDTVKDTYEINSDLTNDDVISMEEAYVYASNYDHYEHHSVPYVDRVETLYYSLPNHFGYDWSLSYQPSPAELFVRDDESDNGKEATEWYWSSEWRPWESPDIWVRNSNDGLTNQESEPLIVTSTDKTVYVYVRLTNRGFKPYPGHGRYLHLHWARPSLNHSSGSWQPSFPGNPLAPELAILPITATIDTIQSTIVSYAWTVPQALVNEAVNDYSGHLWVDLLARVSDSSRKTMYDNSGLLLPYHYTDMTSVLQSRALAQRSVYANVSNESISVPVTIQNLGSESRTFRIEPQSFPSNTPPACLNLSVTLPVALARIVHGDTTITQPETVSFSTIGPFTLPAQSSYTLMLNGTVNTALAQSNSVFSKALDLYSGNKLVGGATLVMTTGSRGIPLAPSIEGGEEGCEDELGDNGNGIVSTRLLRMTGVDEPVSCRWSDATGTLLSTSDSLAISRQASGTYILTVTALSDGAKASVSKDLSPAPSIKSAVVNGDILTLTLFHAAPAGMKVMVQPTLEAHSPIQTVIPLGETQCAVSLSQLSQGPCVVSLWQGGLMLESVQVMR